MLKKQFPEEVKIQLNNIRQLIKAEDEESKKLGMSLLNEIINTKKIYTFLYQNRERELQAFKVSLYDWISFCEFNQHLNFAIDEALEKVIENGYYE